MKNFLLYIWQFPQHLLALAMIRILKAVKKPYGSLVYWEYGRTPNNKWLSGVSLGQYIILPKRNDLDTVVPHEHGHSKQSLIFGPLYLIIIGIYSSVFCNLWDRVFHKKWTVERRHKWYYNQWCEAWADKLGGVLRTFE